MPHGDKELNKGLEKILIPPARPAAMSGEGTYGVDEGTEVNEDGIKGNDAHRLKWVAVDDVTARHGVAHLNAGSDCETKD